MLTGPLRTKKRYFIFKAILGWANDARPVPSVIGLGGQKIHFVLGRDADDFRDVRQIVKLVEQRFEFLRRRHPEQCPRRLVRLVEIAMWNAPRQTHQIARFGLHPDTVQFQVQHAVLNQDEFVLGGMDMNRDKLTRIAVGLESEGRVRHRLWEINLSKNIPGLAGISRSVPCDAFFESCHDTPPRSSPADATCGAAPVKQARLIWLVVWS